MTACDVLSSTSCNPAGRSEETGSVQSESPNFTDGSEQEEGPCVAEGVEELEKTQREPQD